VVFTSSPAATRSTDRLIASDPSGVNATWSCAYISAIRLRWLIGGNAPCVKSGELLGGSPVVFASSPAATRSTDRLIASDPSGVNATWFFFDPVWVENCWWRSGDIPERGCCNLCLEGVYVVAFTSTAVRFKITLANWAQVSLARVGNLCWLPGSFVRHSVAVNPMCCRRTPVRSAQGVQDDTTIKR